MDFYTCEEISKRVVRIKSAIGEYMYLVKGNTKAALIDAGTGFGYLDKVVATYTDLPVEVYATHAHIDHIGGAFYYDNIHYHKADGEIWEENIQYAKRADYIALCTSENAKSITDTLVQPKQLLKIYIEEGELIDLGGATLEVIETPGHTRGSVCFFLREEGILFSGDACNPRSFLFLPESIGIKSYMKTLTKLIRRSGDFKRILNGHDAGELPRDIFYNVLECCVDILNQTDEHVPFAFMDKTAYAAHAILGESNRWDGVVGNVIYDENRVLE